MRSRTRFGVSLESVCRGIVQFDTLQAAVKQRSVGCKHMRGQVFFVDGKTMVLAGDEYLLGRQVLNRVVGAVMAEFHFHGATAGCQGQQLMSQANPEYGQTGFQQI